MNTGRRRFLQSLAAGCAGTAVLSGQAAAAQSSITIEGGGADVWNKHDQCHFYYQQVTGTFDVTVRVDNIDDTGEWAKAGIMVREGLSPDAKNVMVRYTPSDESSVQWRAKTGGDTNSTTQSEMGSGTTDGNWLRLVREKDRIVGYGSTNGSDWTRVCRLPDTHVDLNEETVVGLSVSSFDWKTMCTATFSKLSGLSPSKNQDIGNVKPSGSVSTTGNVGGSASPANIAPATAGEAVEPGTYAIRNANSGKVLTVKNGSEENRASIIQQSDQKNPSQRWTAEELDDKSFRLTPEHSGMAADLNKGQKKDGANIVQWTWHGSANQRWHVESVGDGEYRIRSALSNKVMAVESGSGADGANVHQTTWSDHPSQRWQFEGNAVQVQAKETEEEKEPSGPATSRFGLDAGFADPAPWLDDDVSVRTVTEPTRDAVEEAIRGTGPRVVVFETSGTIDLNGSPLKIHADNCWIAGQTAPSPGVTFINGRFQVSGDNCIIQHIRSRVGPGSNGNIQGQDSVNTSFETKNIVIDHVSASWSTDECMSVGYRTSDTTFTNNLMYEGLYSPYGNRSEHHYGTLVGDGADNVTLVGNVWAKCKRRLPRLKNDTRSVVANNLAYFFDGGSNLDADTKASFVGNTYLGQVDTSDRVLEGGSAYLEDNTVAEPALDSGTPKYNGNNRLGSKPLWPDGLDAMSSDDVEAHNLANAGARPADRTAHDKRIIKEIRNRAGNDKLDSPYDYWVANVDDAGGSPSLPENTHSLDVPDSGLREWLNAWAKAVEDPNASPP